MPRGLRARVSLRRGAARCIEYMGLHASRTVRGDAADLTDQVRVGDQSTVEVVTLDTATPVAEVRWRLDRELHLHGYPVTPRGEPCGVVTRLDLARAPEGVTVGALVRRPAVTAFPDESLRAAIERMLTTGDGRLVVVAHDARGRVAGILRRKDPLAAHGRRLHARRIARASIDLARPFEALRARMRS
jgi:CBS domain-containing protein